MWSIKCRTAIILQKRKFYKQFLAVIYRFFFLEKCCTFLKTTFTNFHKIQLLQKQNNSSSNNRKIFLLYKNVFLVPFLVFFSILESLTLWDSFLWAVWVARGTFNWYLNDYILKGSYRNNEPCEKVTPSYME